MGGGRKRGRTQRKHFKQSRDNVWKHNPQGQKPPAAAAAGSGGVAVDGEGNPSWQPFATQNLAFEEYYKDQRIIPEGEWEEFVSFLRKPLPAAFRINASCQFFRDICSQLENDFRKSLETEVSDEYKEEPIRPLPWYPGQLAWHLNFSRMQLRKNQALERFHEFLKQENEVGNITRQEAVSMVPPLFLNVLPDHHILDMCAAPGSKTFQLLEMIHQSTEPGSLPSGLVIANDVDVQRCNLLIHQTKRMCSANLIVTNHEAQNFPSCTLMKGCLEPYKEEAKIHSLQFDRVLCDVPCSGDGTLRKAPDMWRKWNAGMGNGLHRLQLDIAMRGIALLKVGGRMVYSTCSMNPIENEAVVAEVLRRCGDFVELLDVSDELPELVRRPGLRTWKVRDKGSWISSYEDVPQYRRSVILPSMFPSGESSKESHLACEGVQVNIDIVTDEVKGDQDPNIAADQSNGGNFSASPIVGDASKVDCESDEVSRSIPAKDVDVNSGRTECSSYPLHRCMRIVPHDQNSGAFFIAILRKLSPLHESRTTQVSKTRRTVSSDTREIHEDEHGPEIRLPEDASLNNLGIVCEVGDVAEVLDEQQKPNLDMENESSKDKNLEEVEACNNGDNGLVALKDRKRKLQMQGKWRGVDPVVFFKDETTIASIVSFYGISESFPLRGHLVTRNNDTNHVKRIYYLSKSVHDILQLNFQVGQRLKITSLGLKAFERQSSKDGSPCAFRLSSEGLPLLLPYISKQILHASLVDFQHLLQYRTIKFSDFVDAKFGEEASALMPGCCVVVLSEGHRSGDPMAVDASTIAIVCWKGKTNLCIMVSPLDGKEMLERLSVRYGPRDSMNEENERSNLEIDGSENAETVEGIEMIDQENFPESNTSDVEHSDDIKPCILQGSTADV